MFQPKPDQNDRIFRVAIAGLLLLSLAALAITIWTMVDFLREQAIVADLMSDLPPEARESARFLAGELQWQFRLTTLVVLNVVVTGIALALLFRAYRHSQTSLRDVRALASDILGSMEQGVLTTDRNGCVTSMNRRGMELFGVTRECVGKPIDEVSGLPLNTFRHQWLQERESTLAREYSVGRDGEARTLRVSCQSLNDYQGDELGNVMQIRDTTESKLVEQRMHRMERYIGLGPLAAGLHHEIKNPLAALSLHFQLLEEQLANQRDGDYIVTQDWLTDQSETLSIIRGELKRIGGVLDAFRDFASLDRLQFEPLNVQDLIERQLQLLRPQAKESDVEIVYEPPRDLPVITGDATRLEQVLLNLCLNAIEAMPDGGRLTIKTNQTDTDVEISVADTGSGVPQENRDKIFDPYFTTKNSGTGLGLAICEKIIREHSGTLGFEATARGTVFTIAFSKLATDDGTGLQPAVKPD